MANMLLHWCCETQIDLLRKSGRWAVKRPFWTWSIESSIHMAHLLINAFKFFFCSVETILIEFEIEGEKESVSSKVSAIHADGLHF